MTSNINPFDVPELVEYCVDFLHDSRPDLEACALVSRAWVYASQYHIFSTTSWESMLNQHQQISRISEISALPHILALISRLEINVYYLGQSDSFSGVISWLTRLKAVRISGNSVPSTPQIALVAIRALIGLPTVECVELYCSFESPAAFIQIWDGCSENIRHLFLGNIRVKDSEYDWVSSPALKFRRKLALDSLYISYGNFVTPWLVTDACPFDFSHLTTLSVCEHVHILRWRVFSRAQLTLKRFRIWLSEPPTLSLDILDLGPFKQLQHLTIIARSVTSLRMAIIVLSSLPTDSRLTSLEIECVSRRETLSHLDDLLFGMPLSELQKVNISIEPRWPTTLEEAESWLPNLFAREVLTVRFLDK
ncbi:hypothetical protein C8F04DRAFT_42588 [Mycena alexandri]|uniref:Uncharacterized protein n=1 Tax=Mycena alexandri TaxID=1745969 RepID=A0AAD6SJW8_9AGAR|nr:hypothetical protein C8F04DRAFT_42588 [Mycena alexandri]